MFRRRRVDASPEGRAMKALITERYGRLGGLVCNQLFVPSAEGVRMGGSDMPVPIDPTLAGDVQPIEPIAEAPTNESV